MFNGEIYNYEQLQSIYKLNSAKTECDVIAEGYKKLGLNFLGQLNGMFAICLYDKANNFIHLSRDFFGQKPLYYYVQGSAENNISVYASSSLKTVSLLANEPLCTQGVAEWIDLGFTLSPRTIYNNIYNR